MFVQPNHTNAKRCEICKEYSRLTHSLTNEELGTLDHIKSDIRFKAGELIFKQGTPSSHFLCLTSGLVKMYIEGYGGKNLILGFAKPCDYIIGPGVFLDNRHYFSAMALVDSSACLIDADYFKTLLRTNADFTESFIKKLSSNSVQYFRQTLSLTQKQMPGRIADVLIHLCKDIYQGNPFSTTLSRQDLADMSSMSKESAIRILKEFKVEGIIRITGNTFEIINFDRIEAISQTG